MSGDSDASKRKVNLRRQPLTVTRWRALLVICASLVTVAIIGIAYTGYVDSQRAQAERRARAELEQQEREADRRWCLLLTTLNRAYSSTPPQSEIGRQVAGAVLNLTLELGCPVG